MAEAPAHEPHWAAQRERGSFVLMKLTALALRWLGRGPVTPVLYLIVCYFFVFGRRARASIRSYQARLACWSGQPGLRPSSARVFAQFMAFGDSILDRLQVWRGRLDLAGVAVDDPDGVRARLRSGGRGEILVVAHLGNLDVCRALAESGEATPLNVLVHTRHAERINRLQAEAGDRRLRLLQVSEMDAATMMDLSQRVERGEWLAIAGDRVPLQAGRRVHAQFLGARAAFPQGPWLLAALLRCPVHMMCCLKQGGRYRIHLRHLMPAPTWRRGEREARIAGCVQRFADQLAQWCLLAPRQWFNFYAFWQDDEGGDDAHSRRAAH